MNDKTISRRTFSKAAGGVLIASSAVLGRAGHTAPNDKLNIASVGVGGKGGGDVKDVSTENIIALCDVDDHRTAGMFERFPKAKKFKDFRVMFDQMENEIDAVTVSTPDHCHAVAVMQAIKRNKHVFCQKPLCHSIWETRMVTEAAQKQGIQTQMGNQGHSSDQIRELCEWVDDGAIGEIREVYAWSDRPVGGHPWSTFAVRSRPEETPPIPDFLDWDLWLGPAPYRPYHPAYCPTKWRAWLDFGTGAIGDMGCHIMDPAFWALDLGSPEYVEATTTHWEEDVASETYPRAAIVRYQFPAKGNRPPVRLTWFDGRLKPPTPDILSPKVNLGTNGALYIGEDGAIIHGSHGAGGLRILPEEKNKSY
ncbi:gfo/Idh/MocA family oxidoreductase, partial [bacterium]|nr:gfo/Idh/MocA family oxidoreductase [bacterium]